MNNTAKYMLVIVAVAGACVAGYSYYRHLQLKRIRETPVSATEAKQMIVKALSEG
jgi:O-antigen/teichoic acid export membrane protein